MRIVLSGGTGFIGKALLRTLVEADHQVVLLTRNPVATKRMAVQNVQVALWDGTTVGPWADFIEGSHAVINLAGEPVVGKRWNDTQKARLIASRIESTKALTSAIAQSKQKPSVLINASAVGYYGHVEKEDVTESHPKGVGFLADLAHQWEQETLLAQARGVRVVILRIGVVLEKDGGALSKMVAPFRYFVGGPLGSGRQWVPWIHRHDVIRIILFALHNTELQGPVNTTSPNPVTMKEFCKTLGQAVHRPSWAPVPAATLRLLLGESSDVLLTGQRALPKKLESVGYTFRYTQLNEALHAILSQREEAIHG